MLGQTKFRERENGTWWQSGPSAVTDNNLISSSYLIGLKWAGERYGFRIGYTRLGDYAGDNWASVWDEDADHVLTATTCDPVSANNCPALYKGTGRAQGVYFGPTVENRWGKWGALAEAGLFFFRSTYDVSVFHPYDDHFVPKGNTYEYRRASGDHWTWYVGLQLSYKLFRDADLVVLLRQYYNVYEQGLMPGGDVGLTGGRTRQLLAGVSIPF